MRHDKISNLKLHLDTAELLIKGVKESLQVHYDTSYGYNFVPSEHSDESVIRRCVQIRQELLQVIKKLR